MGEVVAYLGREYRFRDVDDSGIQKADFLHEGGSFPGSFLPDVAGKEKHFVPDNTNTPAFPVDLVERPFYADAELCQAETDFFTNMTPPASICIEEFKVLNDQTADRLYTGKIDVNTYLDLFQKATGVTYNPRVAEVIKARGRATQLWVKKGHKIKRPVFARRSFYTPEEEASLHKAELEHHHTNRAFKDINFAEISFEECLELAKSYLFGTIDFSRARIRDMITAVTDHILENSHREDINGWPQKLAFLISPSFQSLASELEHLFGNRVIVARIDLVRKILSQYLPEVITDFPENPLRTIRKEMLLGGKVDEERLYLMLAREIVFQVLRNSKDRYPLKSPMLRTETEYRANQEVALLTLEECRRIYEKTARPVS